MLQPALPTRLPRTDAATRGDSFTALTRVPEFIALATIVVGTAVAWHYAGLGLTLTHWDARAHLVVSRRILDSLYPGWQQIGAVWLPLPHVLNMLPVQVDAWYRTGASAVAISILSMGLATWALSSFVLRTTGSTAGAIAGSALLMGSPDVLYLQSTPMTEPLLFGTTLLAIELTRRWTDDPVPSRLRVAGLALIAASMTRYEAWPITAALVLIAAAVLIRRGADGVWTIKSCTRLALYPIAAVLLFLVNSRWTIGAWFISSGFFVPNNTVALGHPFAAWSQVREGVYHLSGTALVWSAYAGTILLLVAFWRSRTRATLVLALALVAAGLLPSYAYYEGHPFIARYGIPLVVASAAICGTAIGLLWRPVRAAAAIALVVVAFVQAAPLDRQAPMIVEALRDVQNIEGRKMVTAYLASHYDGRPIMVSMGSLAHYVQDLSHQGFRVHDFLHEGNNALWTYAAIRPRGYVGWILIEEKAEGGDSLFLSAKRDKHFLDGFKRVAEGGGVALYEATEKTARGHGGY